MQQLRAEAAAATVLQAAWRGHVVRHVLHKQHAAATMVQAAWRCVCILPVPIKVVSDLACKVTLTSTFFMWGSSVLRLSHSAADV